MPAPGSTRGQRGVSLAANPVCSSPADPPHCHSVTFPPLGGERGLERDVTAFCRELRTSERAYDNGAERQAPGLLPALVLC